jgi:hypothetical protein
MYSYWYVYVFLLLYLCIIIFMFMYSYCYVYVFLLLYLRILIAIFMYYLFYVYVFLLLCLRFVILCILIVMFMYSYCYVCTVAYSVSLCRSVYCLCVNVYCTVLLPPGVNPIAVNKYTIYHITNVAPYEVTMYRTRLTVTVCTRSHELHRQSNSAPHSTLTHVPVPHTVTMYNVQVYKRVPAVYRPLHISRNQSEVVSVLLCCR